MRILPPILDIGDTEGFTEQNDIFQRAAFGRGLSNLVQRVEDPLVILLDSPWGSGKTTFLKMWAGELRKAGHPVVYFDAFAHDHIDNAFLAIAGEVIGLAKRRKGIAKPKVTRFVNAAAKTGGILLRSAAKIGVKAATLGAIDAAELGDELADVADDIAGAASEHVDELVKGLLERQAEEKATLERFRVALGELAVAMAPPAPQLEGQERAGTPALMPLVFILDELDRCRPPFALDLLETIKHLFSVPHVQFVLASNHAQLEASVRYGYGGEIDAGLYLQKFYNFSVTFPEIDADRGTRTRKQYIEYLALHLTAISPRYRDQELMLFMLEDVAEARELSFRTIERIATTLATSLALTPENHLKLAPIVAGLAILKVCDPVLFRKARAGSITMDEVDRAFQFDKWPKRGSSDAEWVRNWWVYCTVAELPPGDGIDWRQWAQQLFRYNVRERIGLVPLLARTVVERLSGG